MSARNYKKVAQKDIKKAPLKKQMLTISSGKLSPFKKSNKSVSINLEEAGHKIFSLEGNKRTDFLHSLYNKYSDSQIADQMAQKYNLEKLDLSTFKLDPKIVLKIPIKICQKYSLIPVQEIEGILVIAFSDPGNLQATEDISMIINSNIEQVVANRNQINTMIGLYHENKNENSMKNISALMESSEEQKIESDADHFNANIKNDPVVKMVDAFIDRGVELGCSDIHMEIYEQGCRVRFRVDGALLEAITIPIQQASRVVSRIKMLSKLDISEKRLPQDGRLNKKIKNKMVSFRVSTVPVTGGEKVVLRILDTSSLGTNLENLGMNKQQLDIFKKYLTVSQGLILMTGPTGSGKTTTIYSGLKLLNQPNRNISTAEDPIEYKIYGINQVQINTKIELTFSRVLKSFLRQDPDVILVGEIRDIETTNIAYRAAATGHLVLSTLHTNDAASTITRLMDMGLPSYSVAENTSVIIAQRLLRVLCKECKIPANITSSALQELGCSPTEIEKIKPHVMKIGQKTDCSFCNNIGYKGRIAVFEVLELTPELKEGIFKGLSPRELKLLAVKKNNLQTLRKSALEKLTKGITTVEEVLYGTLGDEL